MRVALVVDWLLDRGGVERVLKELIAIYPQAELYSLINFSKEFNAQTTFLQKIPFIKRFYPFALPLMSFAIEQIDLSSYDLIISCSHAVAKGVITNADQLHICYCQSPMRYAWDLSHDYLKTSKLNWLQKICARIFLHKIRLWDVVSSNRVDLFLSNSNLIKRRIGKIYRREAKTLYPPIDTDFFAFSDRCDDYYVTVCRLVPYKRVDLIVEAFNALPDKKLVIVGEGEERKRLMKKAGKNITFLGSQSDAALLKILQHAKAFIYAAVEDFGIAPLEAQSCGTPVIALKAGGLQETIRASTGVFFNEQTKESLIAALHLFEKKKIKRKRCRQNAENFSRLKFRETFAHCVDQNYSFFIKEKTHESSHLGRRQRKKVVAAITESLPEAIFKNRLSRVSAKKDRAEVKTPSLLR